MSKDLEGLTADVCVSGCMISPLPMGRTDQLDTTLDLTASVSGAFDLIRFTLRQGPLAFYKGYVPAFVRLGPHTVLTFIFLEQLKKNFGHLRED